MMLEHIEAPGILYFLTGFPALNPSRKPDKEVNDFLESYKILNDDLSVYIHTFKKDIYIPISCSGAVGC